MKESMTNRRSGRVGRVKEGKKESGADAEYSAVSKERSYGDLGAK